VTSQNSSVDFSGLKRYRGFMLKCDFKSCPSMADSFFQAGCATVCTYEQVNHAHS